jgi:hypothetical protein
MKYYIVEALGYESETVVKTGDDSELWSLKEEVSKHNYAFGCNYDRNHWWLCVIVSDKYITLEHYLQSLSNDPIMRAINLTDNMMQFRNNQKWTPADCFDFTDKLDATPAEIDNFCELLKTACSK